MSNFVNLQSIGINDQQTDIVLILLMSNFANLQSIGINDQRTHSKRIFNKGRP